MCYGGKKQREGGAPWSQKSRQKRRPRSGGPFGRGTATGCGRTGPRGGRCLAICRAGMS
ncbi:hypothetical protein HMPREF0262_00625 [Clostridium sp. ATCC 29733]|nr:hypothetical protein HMPREF0262_00625 [Clostridium sp. ATCC 29733]